MLISEVTLNTTQTTTTNAAAYVPWKFVFLVDVEHHSVNADLEEDH